MGSRAQQFVFWGIVLLALALRLYRLDAQSFWIDEIFQIIDASRPLGNFLGPVVDLDLGATHKSPLSLALHHALLRIDGGEFILRLPSALFSAAEVAVLFILARAVLGWLTAALAALLLAISPLHIWYAQELRYYSLWNLLTTCAFLALAIAWIRPRVRVWLAYVGSMMLSGMAFVVGVLIVPLHWLSGALLWRRPETSGGFRRGFALVQGVALAAMAAPVGVQVLTAGVGSVGTPRALDPMALPYTFFTYAVGYSVGPSVRELHFSRDARDILLEHPEVLLVLAVFAPLIALGTGRLLRRTPAREFLLPWAFGFPVLVYLAAVLLDTGYNVRYTLPALTAFTVVLAVGIRAIASVRLRAAAAAAVVLCMGFALANHYFASEYHKADVRSAVAHLRAAGGDEAPVAVTGQVLPAVGYYGGKELSPLEFRDCRPNASDAVTVARWSPDRKVYPTESVPRARFENAPRLWLVSGRDWRRTGEACLAWLKGTHTVAERQDFPGIELYELVRRQEVSSR